jgi:hypothetical protein
MKLYIAFKLLRYDWLFPLNISDQDVLLHNNIVFNLIELERDIFLDVLGSQ